MQTAAFLDWGIGGLSVLKQALQIEPQLNGLYFSDAGFTPYGKVPHPELRRRLEKVFHFLISQGADILVVACNAASTAIFDLNQFNGYPVLNVIKPTIDHCLALPKQKFGIIGGQRTIESHIYKNSIEKMGPSEVYESVAQPLSALIEKGLIKQGDVQSDLELIMRPLIEAKIDSLVLACTHYPALNPVFHQLYPNLNLIDPAIPVIETLQPLLQAQAAGNIKYFTTGPIEPMKRAAKLAFDVSISDVISPRNF